MSTCSNIMLILLESMHTTFAFRLYCIFEQFTYLLFLNEYTQMRKCVCLDTRLHTGSLVI